MKRKCLHCQEDENRGKDRWIVVICLADYPTGSRYWDSEYEWLHSRAFCAKHAKDADENGFVKHRPRGKHRRDWRETA
jgi:hypothetical protein